MCVGDVAFLYSYFDHLLLLLHFVSGIAETKCILVTALCVSVCLSLAAFPHYCTDSNITWGNDRGASIFVHHLTDLQSVQGFRCYDNIHVCKLIALYTANAYSAEREMSASARTRSIWLIIIGLRH